MVDKVLVTGGSGLVGRAIQKCLPDAIFLSSKDVDLRDCNKTQAYFNFVKPEYVIHLAARVGGVKANHDQVGDFFVDNIRINTNVLEAAKNVKVKKLLSFLSTCVYPDDAVYPLTENQIHAGEPHFTHFGYAYAKRMLDVQTRAYFRQYGCNFISVVPNNLYGEHDNFDLNDSPVLPALIRKIYEAKMNNTSLVVWGDGRIYRQFTYVDDIVKIICHLLANYDDPTPLNVGNAEEYLLRDVIEMLCNIMDFQGNIEYDASKPKGQLRKPSSSEKLRSIMNMEYTPLEHGLKKTCDWFIENYPCVRGKN